MRYGTGTVGAAFFHCHFVMIRYFREAAVQTEEFSDLEENLDHASVILVISVLVILLTAPVGAVAVMLGGPRLLEQATHHPHPDQDDSHRNPDQKDDHRDPEMEVDHLESSDPV
jgi:hypothetical protein